MPHRTRPTRIAPLLAIPRVHQSYAIGGLLPLAVILSWNVVIIVAIVTLITAALMLYLSSRVFGGVNGDVVGAANEIIRCMVMVTLAVLL